MFTTAEAEPGNERVVVLSHGLWQEHFGGSRDVLGGAMELDGEAYEIVGVMPAWFRDFFNPDAEFWAPVQFPPQATEARTWEFLNMVARLDPAVTPEEGERALESLSARLKEA